MLYKRAAHYPAFFLWQKKEKLSDLCLLWRYCKEITAVKSGSTVPQNMRDKPSMSKLTSGPKWSSERFVLKVFVQPSSIS